DVIPLLIMCCWTQHLAKIFAGSNRMNLVLYKSNRLETLAQRLVAEVLASPLSSPFKAEQVIVQTQGMAQWLKLELSKRQGIAANVLFPFPRVFLSRLMKEILPENLRLGAIEPDVLTWLIIGRLDALLNE